MKAFTRLWAALDAARSADEKVSALRAYFTAAPPEDAAWAVYLLTRRRTGRVLDPRALREWAAEAAGIPRWLFEESCAAVGDLAETIALVLPDPESPDDRPLSWWVERRLLPLRRCDHPAAKSDTLRAWRELDRAGRYLWNRLLTGSFRAPATQRQVVRALADVTGIDGETISHRLLGSWEPSREGFARLAAPDTRDADAGRPYPFCVASALESGPAALGDRAEWLAERHWGGVRAQLVRRGGRSLLWTSGGELLSGRFPEVEEAGGLLPEGTVLEGTLLPWSGPSPLPPAELKRRLGCPTPGAKLLREVPVALVAGDLLMERGEDLRGRPLDERRRRLAALLAATPSAGGRLVLSPPVDAPDWADLDTARATARDAGAAGLLLRRRAGRYAEGRVSGDWWEWSADPLTVDAVLLYAQPLGGLRTGLYADYTFGLWEGDRLVPFARAASGLSDAEVRRVDAFVRRNTVEKFGPVRTVKPELVFQLAFDGVDRSPRHKSGIAVRSPRIARWLAGKRADQAGSLGSVRAMVGG